MCDPTPSPGLLGDPREAHDCGRGAGIAGRPLDGLLADLAAGYGRLTLWQRVSLIEGWVAGANDRDAYERDRAGGVPAGWDGGEELPF